MGLKNTINLFKEDLKVFQLVHREPGIAKYFYYPDIRTVLIFRLSQFFFAYKATKILSYLLTNINDLIAGVWIGPRARIEQGLLLGHSRGLVINPSAKIGKFCSIMQRVTIGGPNVSIGDYVEIGAGASIISNPRGNAYISIGNHVVIGAGAVVVNDIPNCSVVVGVPGKVVKRIEPDQDWLSFRKKLNERLRG